MPSSVYPVPKFRRRSSRGIGASHSARPSLGLKLKVWSRRDKLDERLAGGDNPLGNPALHLRAEQLASRTERVRLAEALEDVLREAHTTRAVLTARVAPRRAEVRACTDDLAALVRRLRDERPIDVQGAAMASRLLFDGASPLYYEAAALSLRYTVRSARLALDHIGDAEPALPTAA
jgi:hypothetical protein